LLFLSHNSKHTEYMLFKHTNTSVQQLPNNSVAHTGPQFHNKKCRHLFLLKTLWTIKLQH